MFGSVYRPADLVVADMGCGEAKIAQSVRQKVHSFDLVARNRYITACDMSQVTSLCFSSQELVSLWHQASLFHANSLFKFKFHWYVIYS